MKCEKCGQEIDVPGKFCPHCGAPIDGGDHPGKKQKKTKKPFYKRWWFWVIVVIFLLGSCGGNTQAPEETAPATETVAAAPPTETTAAATEAPTTEAPTTESPTTEAATVETAPAAESASSEDLDAAVVLIELVVKDHFEHYDVYHENGIITVNVWADGVAIGATLAAGGSEKYITDWNDLVESQKEMCLSICDLVDTLGLEETMVMVSVLNDGNTDNVLLSIMEGVVIYDCVNSQ